MMKIMFDTNFLLYCAKDNLFFELEDKYPKAKFIALDQILFELEKIKNTKFKATTKERISASTALGYLELQKEKGKLEIIKVKGNDVDKLILGEAKKLNDKNFFVATMDEKLSTSLKKEHIKLLKIRQNKNIIEE